MSNDFALALLKRAEAGHRRFELAERPARPQRLFASGLDELIDAAVHALLLLGR